MSDWILLDDRVPQKNDWDADNQIWVLDAAAKSPVKQLFTYDQNSPTLAEYTHWKPTGVTEPIPVPVKRLERVLYARGLVRFGDLEPGSMFAFRDSVCLKSEYRTDAGAPQAYIFGSGEMFWGGAANEKALCELMVQPMDLR